MSVRAVSVTVTTTPVLLTESAPTGGYGGGNYGGGEQSFAIMNNGSSTAYLGGPSVTSSTGMPLSAGQSIAFDLTDVQNEVYGITASGTTDCRVLLTNWNG